MINKEAVKRAREEIRDKIGTLDDLPRELSITVANIYYKDALVFLNLRDKGPASFIDSSKPLRKHVDDFLNTIHLVPRVPELIHNLRLMRTTDPKLYNYSVEFFLDVFKYQIKNATKKSMLRRRFERIFNPPEETPYLIGFIYNDD